MGEGKREDRVRQREQQLQQQQREAGHCSKHSRSIRWFWWAEVRVGQFKGFATAVRTCLLLKRHNKNDLLLIYTVESEDTNYRQRKKQVSLREGIDETRLVKC